MTHLVPALSRVSRVAGVREIMILSGPKKAYLRVLTTEIEWSLPRPTDIIVAGDTGTGAQSVHVMTNLTGEKAGAWATPFVLANVDTRKAFTNVKMPLVARALSVFGYNPTVIAAILKEGYAPRGRAM